MVLPAGGAATTGTGRNIIRIGIFVSFVSNPPAYFYSFFVYIRIFVSFVSTPLWPFWKISTGTESNFVSFVSNPPLPFLAFFPSGAMPR